MKKLRLQFLFFFALLQLGISFLLLNSYRQMRIEETSLWQTEATKIFNQMQAQISEMLNSEDARSFKEYRFLIQKNLQSPLSQNINSPTLSKALIGYFQIEPNATFTTPYLPLQKTIGRHLPDYESRLAKQEQIAKSTASFREEIKDLFRPQKKVRPFIAHKSPKPSAPQIPETIEDFTEENAKKSEDFLPQKKLKTTANIYPNPIISKKSAAGFSPAPLTLEKSSEVNVEAPASVARRQELTPSQELKEFKQKTVLGTATLSSFSQKKETQSLVWIDPFQMQTSDEHLIFFRRVWVEEGLYIQGFVFNTKAYFETLMQNAFENSTLPEFSTVRWVKEDTLLAEYGQHLLKKQNVLYTRYLYYPLNKLQWQVIGKDWPQISTRLYLNIFSIFIFLFSTFGLFWIYLSSAAQVKLSQKRQDFVSAITHELKTPLTAIHMYSEMLENEWVDNENKRKEYIQNIHQESSRLSRLIENVLQMARLEKQKYSFHLSTKNPSEDLEKWEKEFSTLAKKSGFNFKLDLPANIPVIRYESEALKEVFLILLENSIKFGKEVTAKNIELKLEINLNEKLYFIWKDDGPGVAQEELKSIFEKFYRVENELTRKTKGTGIGLSIAKAILEGMGASIEATANPKEGLQMKIGFCI